MIMIIQWSQLSEFDLRQLYEMCIMDQSLRLRDLGVFIQDHPEDHIEFLGDTELWLEGQG